MASWDRRQALWAYLGLTALFVGIATAGPDHYLVHVGFGSIALFVFLFTAVCFGSRSARYVLSFFSAWFVVRNTILEGRHISWELLVLATIAILQIGCLISAPMQRDRLW